MHYYPFNIGDYRRDTAHLSLLEHGIYRQLIDTYYLSEKPLPLDMAVVMRTHCVRTAEEKQALEYVLGAFFDKQEDGFYHAGCDKVLEKYRARSDKARASAMARWNHSDANALPTHSERNAIGMLTNNQEPITNKKETTKAKIRAPEGVSQSVWESFLEQRKKARAVVTDTVLKSIVSEAKKAGWTVEQAMTEMVVRGWRGFKADWVAGKGVIEKPVRWNSTVDGIMEKGKELGITHRQGETIGQYEERIREAIPGPASLARQ